jgi:hypothetical protein
MATLSIVVQIILAFAKAFPIVEKWLDEAYNEKIKTMSKENRAAIKKAIDEQDQRDLEIAMGSTKPGEASGIPGTVITDSWPGVD